MKNDDRTAIADESAKREAREDFVWRNIAAVAPFAVWLAMMSLLPEKAWAYAARTAATAVAAIALWRLPQVYGAFGFSRNLRGVPYGVLAGVGVALAWMIPEMDSVIPAEAVAFYKKWFVGVPGFDPEPEQAGASPYSPAACGAVLTYVKFAGSAAVIATVEEVFFRSFLYRWLQGRHFSSIPGGRFELSAFAMTVFLFAIEHDRWLAGAVAGIVYGLVSVRLGLASAIAAHVTTNAVIGIAVMQSSPFDKWGFW